MTAKSVRQQFADTMLELGQEDPNLVVLVGDISHFALQPFANACPGRYFNIGICEPTMVSMAAGLSKLGFHPVAHTIAPFIIDRSFEQIKLDFCYQQLGGNLITVGSVFDYANLGCSHHCYADFALLKTLQGTQLCYPASAIEFDSLFRQIYDCGKLNLFRLPAHQHGLSFKPDEIVFGKAIKVRNGSNLTIVATGPQLSSALAAVDALSSRGWDSEILYVHTLRPLDVDSIRESVSKTGAVLTIEEHARTGGLGQDVLYAIRDILDVRFASLAIPDTFVTSYGTYQSHCEMLDLTPAGIVHQVEREFALPTSTQRKTLSLS